MPLTEIILTENISGLGAEADVVKVRRGYARNFLLPKGKAYEVTKSSLRQLDNLKAKRAAREAAELNEAEELARRIGKLKVVFMLETGETGKAFAKKFQIGGLSRDKLYPLVKCENSRVVYLQISASEKDMPKSIHVSLDGRSGARIREIDFDLSSIPVSTRTAKGLTVSKWPVKEVKEV